MYIDIKYIGDLHLHKDIIIVGENINGAPKIQNIFLCYK